MTHVSQSRPDSGPGLPSFVSAVERGGTNLNSLKYFRTENSSSQGQNLAVTLLFVPSSLDSGWPESGLDCLICAEFARQRHTRKRAPPGAMVSIAVQELQDRGVRMTEHKNYFAEM